jgi:hypothetical protein
MGHKLPLALQKRLGHGQTYSHSPDRDKLPMKRLEG